MARVTIEDCLEKIANRFELIKVAAQRARRLTEFSEAPHVSTKNDRNTVIALREIAAGHIAVDAHEAPTAYGASTVDNVTETIVPEEVPVAAVPESTPAEAVPESTPAEAVSESTPAEGKGDQAAE